MSEFVDTWYKKLVDTKNDFPYNEVELWGMDESAIEDAYDSGELNEDDYNSLLDGYPEFFAGDVLSELGLD